METFGLLRVYRDPASPFYLSGPEKLPDDVKAQATQKGWVGPWELTTWAELILEVLRDPMITMESLPKVPKEHGARSTSLHYTVTGLDGWASPAADCRKKRRRFRITPELWVRDGEPQMLGGIASRAASPVHADEVIEVEVSVMLVMVCYEGVFSVGAEIKVVSENPELHVPDRERVLVKRKLPKRWQKMSKELKKFSCINGKHHD